ncbi:MAG: L-rhamnose isomerase [Candidatus Aminicenantes bacterium]|nr:MAG: L-rhamnose isomerase [Candidatus Aminicenantes bacterium]
MGNTQKIEHAYEMAKDIYAQWGVDVDEALRRIELISISLPCWQGDDVIGFEKPNAQLTRGGIQVTGDYPGRARTADELRMDLDMAFSLIPGSHRLNLHSMYGEGEGEFGNDPVDRDILEYDHYKGWVEWADQKNIKLDFNATCFSHPMAASGFTLSSKSAEIRTFWIEHVKRCRAISFQIGRELGSPCIHNLWIPDGMKDIPVDRRTPRFLLKESLDEIFTVEYPNSGMKDSLESKLFGIGSESYVVGSHEFYLGYAQSRDKMLCLDAGHFHPTESLADKISAILLFFEELLLHLSRGIRWDSDHPVIQRDDLQDIANEIIQSGQMDRIHVALDFFDASMNRVGAWVISARATLKSILSALLQPWEKLQAHENEGNFFARLALMEESKTLPIGAVWDYYCSKKGVPHRDLWIQDIMRYESEILKKRSE